MKINFADNSFLTEIENYTGSLLFKKDDIKKIINVVVTDNREKDFAELTFTAKYICGLMHVMKNAQTIPEVNSVEHIKNDLNINLKKGIEQLKQIISSFNENDKSYFGETYLKLTTQSFNDLSNLFSDLESVKKYLNYLKRKT